MTFRRLSWRWNARESSGCSAAEALKGTDAMTTMGDGRTTNDDAALDSPHKKPPSSPFFPRTLPQRQQRQARRPLKQQGKSA